MNATAGQQPIELLFTLDENYLPRLEVVFTSLFASNPGEAFRAHVIHRGIPEAKLAVLAERSAPLGIEVVPQQVDEALFADAPTTDRYPEEMYYRLLAGQLLPTSLTRVLYIDPDVLIINPLRPLWEVKLGRKLFAAAAHVARPAVSDITENVNNVRLGTEGRYFNSGVLLMDLERARTAVEPAVVFEYARDHTLPLLLPDQDILNALYGSRILEVDELRWNYDARQYHSYFLTSQGEADVDWVMHNTSIIHFCGRSKPWDPSYRYRFGVLYKHYMKQAERFFGPLSS